MKNIKAYRAVMYEYVDLENYLTSIMEEHLNQTDVLKCIAQISREVQCRFLEYEVFKDELVFRKMKKLEINKGENKNG